MYSMAHCCHLLNLLWYVLQSNDAIAVHGNYMPVVYVVGAKFVVWSIEDGAMYCRRGKICWAKRSGFKPQ